MNKQKTPAFVLVRELTADTLAVIAGGGDDSDKSLVPDPAGKTMNVKPGARINPHVVGPGDADPSAPGPGAPDKA